MEITNKTIATALAQPCWVTKIDANHYHCVPQKLVDVKSKREHGKYDLTVTFNRQGLPIVERCIDSRTRRNCKGFKNHGHCYHQIHTVAHILKQQIRKAA